MAYQSAKNVRVAYKAESAFNTLPGATGATQFRINSGSLNMTKAPIVSNEIRPDGLISRGRHGQRDVAGSYEGDLSVGTFDALFAAVFRSSAFGVELVITNSPAITTTANTIVGATGSWITAGLRVGDVIYLTSHSTAGNNGRLLTITALTATIITVAETLTVDAAPDSTYTLTRPKKLVQSTTPTSFTFEETEQDIDSSEVFTGVRVGSMKLTLAPNEMAKINFGLVGADMQTMTGASSPYFTSPTNTTGLGLTAVEAKLVLNGVPGAATPIVVDLTALDLTLDLTASGIPLVGATITPDVWTNSAAVTGSITSLRQDVNRVGAFIAESQLSLQATFAEVAGTPPKFISFFVPNLTFAGSTKSDLGADGPRTQQQPLLIGADDRTTGEWDKTTVKIITNSV